MDSWENKSDPNTQFLTHQPPFGNLNDLENLEDVVETLGGR